MTAAGRFAGWASLALLLLCAGCRGPETISDRELYERGQWTEADAAARALIGPEQGPLGPRPVRRAPVARKFASLFGAVETLFGWSYEKTYYYLPEQHAYVFVHRDRPPTILGEEWQQGLGPPPPPPTPEEGWELWRERNERELWRRMPGPTEERRISLAR